MPNFWRLKVVTLMQEAVKGIVKLFGGNTHKRTMESLFPLVDEK